MGRGQKLVASNGTAREKRKIPIELGTKYFIIMQQFSTLYSSTPCPPSIQTVPLYRPLCIQKNILISCIFCAHFTWLFFGCFCCRCGTERATRVVKVTLRNSDNKLVRPTQANSAPSLPPLSLSPLGHENFSKFFYINLK